MPAVAIPVVLGPSVRSWDPDWITHYNNAVGDWNLPFASPMFSDEQNLNSGYVWILRPGSDDEDSVNELVLNEGYEFEPAPDCIPGQSSAWATTNAAFPEFIGGDWHARYQKVCVWSNSSGDPAAPDGLNGQNWHWWFLMLRHELGHALSLPDLQFPPAEPLPGSCLMRSGVSMLYICHTELTWVHNHYNR